MTGKEIQLEVKEVLKYDLYIKAFCNTLKNFEKEKAKGVERDLTTVTKKLVLYGVKAVNAERRPEHLTRRDVEKRFEFISIVKDLMSTLSPKEFMNVFSIEKDYDGHKYGAKDYFYTRDYIQTLEQDKPIGEEILNFIWNYHNWEITEFVVRSMSCISDLRRLNGEPSLAEEFADIMGLKTYRMYTDSKGNKFLLDEENGKTIKLQEKRHLHIVR